MSQQIRVLSELFAADRAVEARLVLLMVVDTELGSILE